MMEAVFELVPELELESEPLDALMSRLADAVGRCWVWVCACCCCC